MTQLKLTVNETETRVCRLPEEKFDFLGYTTRKAEVTYRVGLVEISRTVPCNHSLNESICLLLCDGT